MHLPSPSTLPAPSCRPLTAAPRISTTPKSPRATILCASHRAHAAAALLAAATLHLSTPCWAAGTTPEASSSRPGGVDPDSSPLVQELLARSKANKEANDKARLDSYYRRNYKEYFEFVEGTVQRGAELGLSDSTKEGIRRWLEANR